MSEAERRGIDKSPKQLDDGPFGRVNIVTFINHPVHIIDDPYWIWPSRS